jgi:hypothetical protein
MQNYVGHVARPPFSAWPIVRRRLVPLMLLLGFANLIATGLHQRELTIALSIVAFVVPVIAGYEARRRGGSYGNALSTAWLTIVVSLVAVAVPLTAIGIVTGAQPIQLPQGFHADATAYVIGTVLAAIVLPMLMVVVWIAWIPFALLGAWIAGDLD